MMEELPRDDSFHRPEYPVAKVSSDMVSLNV